jgi:hypothetical protein
MRLSALLVATAVAAAVPTVSSAAIMVAHFEGGVGGLHSTGTTRFGVPPLTVFSGPFVAEFRYNSELGSPAGAPPGGETRGPESILDGWIEWNGGGARIDIPSSEFGGVTARTTGFSIGAYHFIAGVRYDTVVISAAFAHNGDLETPVASQLVTGGGDVFASSTFATGAYAVDLFGSIEGQGMQLEVTRFSLSEYVAPTPGTVLPEPGAWALMILGFGGAGAALRRRRAAVA